MAVDVSASSGTHNAQLTESELRLALTLAGVRPCGQSPLADDEGGFMAPLEEPYDDGDVERLFRKGLLAVAPRPELKPEWRRALTVLADPVWDLSMVLGRGADVHYDRYYARGPLSPQSLVFFRPAQSGKPHHLSFPYSPSDILRLLDDALVFTTPSDDDDSGTELSYKEYVVLLACIDALRKQNLEGMLRRDQAAAPSLTLDCVREALSDGLRRDDHRWLVCMGNAVSPFELQIGEDEWARMLEGLERRGYVEALGEGAWKPAGRLSEMADQLLVVPAFSAFELTFNKTADVFEINYFAALRGSGPLWLFDFYELATSYPKVSVAAVSGDELAAMLEGLVDESRAKSEAALRGRPSLERGTPPEATRLPSPPTLRGLKVPSTVDRIKLEAAPEEIAPPPASGDLSDAETVRRARREPPADAPASPPAEALAPESPPSPLSPPAAAAPAQPERPCPYCGLPVLAGKKFCRHCGRELGEAASAANEAPLPLTDTPTVPPRALGFPAVAPGVPSSGELAAPPEPVVASPPPPPPEPVVASPPPPSSDPLSWLRGASPAASEGSGALPPTPAPAPPASPWAATAPAASAGVVPCSVCALPVPETARFCGHCGTNVAALRERTCPACKGRLAPNARFCAFCGHSVT